MLYEYDKLTEMQQQEKNTRSNLLSIRRKKLTINEESESLQETEQSFVHDSLKPVISQNQPSQQLHALRRDQEKSADQFQNVQSCSIPETTGATQSSSAHAFSVFINKTVQKLTDTQTTSFASIFTQIIAGVPLETYVEGWNSVLSVMEKEESDKKGWAFEKEFDERFKVYIAKKLFEEEIARRRFLIKSAKALLALFSLTSAGMLAKALGIQEIAQDLQPEKQIPADKNKLHYTWEKLCQTIWIIAGDSESGHSDKPGDKKNENDQHPPRRYFIDAMEKVSPDFSGQLIYIAKNGSDEQQILDQFDTPVFQIALGRELSFEQIIQQDRLRKGENQQPLNQEVLIYVTQRTHSSLRKLVEIQNGDHIQNQTFYPILITSQEDIVLLQEAFAEKKALGIDKSSGGDTLVNYIMYNQEHPEYRHMFDTAVDNPKSLAGIIALFQLIELSLPRLESIRTYEKRIDEKMQNENKLSQEQTREGKGHPLQIENVVDIQIPSRFTSLSVPVGETGSRKIDAASATYTQKSLPSDGLLQNATSMVTTGIGNAQGDGRQSFYDELSHGEKATFSSIRLPSLSDDRNQHYTNKAYKKLCLIMMELSYLAPMSFLKALGITKPNRKIIDRIRRTGDTSLAALLKIQGVAV